MKQVVAINKKLNNIMKENADIKDEVEEISQFLTDNDFAIANVNNDQDGEQLSLRVQNNAILYHHHDYPSIPIQLCGQFS